MAAPRGAPPPWRVALATWAHHTLAGGDPDPPAPAPALVDLARRARLSGDAARALALLYGAWILGQPDVPLLHLARTIAWDELAGSGSLPQAGLTAVLDGRLRLRPAVARFLDGAAPEHVTLHGDRARPDVAPGRQVARVSPDLPVASSARGLAERMGAAAIVDELHARGAAELATALDEAWLRRLPVIAVPGMDLDATTLAAAPLRADHALVIVWPDAIVPAVLETLSQLEP